MELVRYTLCDIDLMVVDIEGTLYCSTPQLERVFGADKATLTRLVKQYPQDFSDMRCNSLTLSNGQRKEVLDALELTRLRQDTRLWSEDDVIGITWLVRSDIARKFRVEFKDILKQHSKRQYVSKDMFEQSLAQNQELASQVIFLTDAVKSISERMDEVEAQRISAEAQRNELASYAGRALRAVR